MSTIHNPVNFKPEDYFVMDYIDNHPPVFMGGPMLLFSKAVEAWRENIKRLNVQGGIHQCCHCGNGNVRYVAICHHKPSNRNVCFGSDCVERLNFEGADVFKAAHIRTKANNDAIAAKRWEALQQFLSTRPELAQAFELGKDNTFVSDVYGKLLKWGNISDAQIAAVIRSGQYKKEKIEQPPAGPVPTGKRIEFEGLIVHRKTVEGLYGSQFKFLVLLDNGSKIWCTEPNAFDHRQYTDRKSVKVWIRATVEASKDDATFGFAKRPHLIKQESVIPLPDKQ